MSVAGGYGERELSAIAPDRQGGAFVLYNTSDGPAWLEIVDAAGRQVGGQDLSPLGMGRHVVSLDDAERLAPGLYVVRVVQRGRCATTRLAIAR